MEKKENLRQYKLYNEYLKTKEIELNNEKKTKLPKLRPLDEYYNGY